MGDGKLKHYQRDLESYRGDCYLVGREVPDSIELKKSIEYIIVNELFEL